MLSVSHVVRLANRLHAVWAARAAPVPDPESAGAALEARLQGIVRLRRRYGLAVERQFRLAASIVRREWIARLTEVRDLLGRMAVESAPSGFRAPDLSEWVRELRHLEDEFGGVEVRWGDAVVRVVTGPVTLRGVELGRFAVDFHWHRLGSRVGAGCFDVVAVEPNPAAGRTDIVHPHVRDHGLCAGDAERPLERALRDGRLADAVLLVRSVLETYNPDSPYVPLAEWDGFACADCGRTGHPDDRYACEACDADLCDGCADRCGVCATGRCSACLESCAACDDACCSGCLETTDDGRRACPTCLVPCSHCSARVPKDELTDPAARCPACAADEDDDDDGNDSDATSEPEEVGRDVAP